MAFLFPVDGRDFYRTLADAGRPAENRLRGNDLGRASPWISLDTHTGGALTQPDQVDEMLQALDLLNDVVVQL